MGSASAQRILRPKKAFRHKTRYETRVLFLALATGAAGLIYALVDLWLVGDHSPKVQWTFTLLIVGCWLSFAYAVRNAVVRPLQTLSNMQAALREGDFSIRARQDGAPDALSELMFEVNALSEALHEQRLGNFEASALLKTVMSEIDVAVFAFDSDQRLRITNRAGERLIGMPVERANGLTARELELTDLFEGESAHTIERSFPGGTGRYSVKRSRFRQGGVPHDLIVIADLSRALREEERQAWQRLVRVLGHELNNSLAPIKSIGQSLVDIIRRPQRAPDWEDDMKRGLHIITERADALTRFMQDYSRLARLPKPQRRPMDVGELVRRIVALEQRVPVELEPGPDVQVNADPDQLEQLLINLLRNAVDASLETQGKVCAGWERNGNQLSIWIDDEGPGIANAANLFVPFFTTKQGGSGIGLALSRQIAEAHGGVITLQNRASGQGCQARFTLPIE
jgi:two-component system, NtrC family, nitrogen regulation sensor histidine kinase NtrY